MYINSISGFPEDYASVHSERPLLLVLPTGDCIFSANEICRFLCSECGQDGLCGDSPEDQALIDHWLGWEASELKVYSDFACTTGSVLWLMATTFTATVTQLVRSKMLGNCRTLFGKCEQAMN